jgi:hypothetical protein
MVHAPSLMSRSAARTGTQGDRPVLTGTSAREGFSREAEDARMKPLKLVAATTAAIGTLALAVPIAGAATNAPVAPANPSGNVCLQVAMQGPFAVLGPYGVLGDYGPLGTKPNEENPAAQCFSQGGSGASGLFGMPGMTGMFGF